MSHENKKILCVGMCVLDIIHVCEEYPQEDTDKRCVRGHWQRGGNASNNCTVLSQLKAPCEFLGVLSDAIAFQFLKQDCIQRQIHIQHCPTVQLDPPFSSVLLNQLTNSRTIIHSNPNFPILNYQNFQNINLFDYKWIHFEGRNPEETTNMINAIHEHNLNNPNHIIQISIELEKMKPKLLELTKYVDYVFLGKDLAMLLNWKNSKEAVYGLRELIDNKKCTIICPWSKDGCSILTETGDYQSIPAYPPSNIVDTLGAGDTFCAGTIYGLAEKQFNIKEAVEFGNRLSGYKISFYGYDQIGSYKF